MNPITGAIRSKAIYRFMGTLGAGVVSLVLAAIFVNTPVLLIAVMWLAETATLAVSLIDRTPRSYGFLLFGVTMTIGRAEGRERVWQDGSIQVVEVAVKQKQ